MSDSNQPVHFDGQEFDSFNLSDALRAAADWIDKQPRRTYEHWRIMSYRQDGGEFYADRYWVTVLRASEDERPCP